MCPGRCADRVPRPVGLRPTVADTGDMSTDHATADRSDDLQRAILELLGRRRQGATLCPSEAARAVAGTGKEWRPLMDGARAAAAELVASGDVVITQGGEVVDPATARGPIRIRLTGGPPSDG